MTEWGAERLDLDAYLARVGWTGDAAATPGTLRALHRAHVGAITFENLDIPLGRGVDTDLEAVQAKLVAGGRGGYCYEQNVLFAAVLERLGFTVERLLARVGDREPPRPRTHLTLRVSLGGERWLADVGFGSGLLTPLAFDAGGVQEQGRWAYELRRTGDHDWELHELGAGEEGWTLGYRFDDVRQRAADVVMANHFSATHPSSPFTTRIVAVRKDEERVRRLLGRTLETARPGAAPERCALDDDEYVAALRGEFGLRLSDADAARLTDLTREPA